MYKSVLNFLIQNKQNHMHAQIFSCMLLVIEMLQLSSRGNVFVTKLLISPKGATQKDRIVRTFVIVKFFVVWISLKRRSSGWQGQELGVTAIVNTRKH